MKFRNKSGQLTNKSKSLIRFAGFVLIITAVVIAGNAREKQLDYYPETPYIIGTVDDEFIGNITDIVERGLTAKELPYFAIKVNTDKGTYYIDIKSRSLDLQTQTIYELSEQIEAGSQIAFPEYYVNEVGDRKAIFSKAKIGTVPPEYIELVSYQVSQN
jgi:hypothetical protein